MYTADNSRPVVKLEGLDLHEETYMQPEPSKDTRQVQMVRLIQ